MSLPFFYIEDYQGTDSVVLDEDTSKHIVQVLRMKQGEALQLTDGEGSLLQAIITDDHKKRCTVAIQEKKYIPQHARHITIGISLLKNNSRFEWFLEKATELGINAIAPLLCDRTEKQHFRSNRMKNILVSAMLQSQQAWIPVLSEPTPVREFIATHQSQQKFIAHCEDGLGPKILLSDAINESVSSQLILIGPEGDFSVPEIEKALEQRYTAVSLGTTRLRAETAGMVAGALLVVG